MRTTRTSPGGVGLCSPRLSFCFKTAGSRSLRPQAMGASVHQSLGFSARPLRAAPAASCARLLHLRPALPGIRSSAGARLHLPFKIPGGHAAQFPRAGGWSRGSFPVPLKLCVGQLVCSRACGHRQRLQALLRALALALRALWPGHPPALVPHAGPGAPRPPCLRPPVSASQRHASLETRSVWFPPPGVLTLVSPSMRTESETV